MGARHKLNQLYFLIAAVFAGTIGLASQSWLVFFGVLAAIVALGLHGGDIRPDKRGR